MVAIYVRRQMKLHQRVQAECPKVNVPDPLFSPVHGVLTIERGLATL